MKNKGPTRALILLAMTFLVALLLTMFVRENVLILQPPLGLDIYIPVPEANPGPSHGRVIVARRGVFLRTGLFAAAALILFTYGYMVNVLSWDFGRLLRIYIVFSLLSRKYSRGRFFISHPAEELFSAVRS